jgi:hypothetical protein
MSFAINTIIPIDNDHRIARDIDVKFITMK